MGLLIGPVVPEDDENDIAEFSGNGANSGKVVLPTRPQPLVILGEGGVTKGRPGGGQPDGTAEIGGATFGDLLPGAAELSRLGYLDIQSREGHQLAGGIKTMDIPDLAEDDGAQGVPNAWDGSDELVSLVEQFGYLGFQLLDLFL